MSSQYKVCILMSGTKNKDQFASEVEGNRPLTLIFRSKIYNYNEDGRTILRQRPQTVVVVSWFYLWIDCYFYAYIEYKCLQGGSKLP